ncbi:MAG: right-handed parallel beta-helix repeat-containing protein, partial [Myxococcota bacterium]
MNEDSQSEELIHQSDDHSTLSRLLRDAQPGAVIKLEARTYTLNKPLVLHRPVTLAGIGQERTRLLGQGDHPVVVASTNVRVELRDLTLGAWRPGHNQDDGTLVVCSLGRFGMTRCRVYGATGKGRGAGAGVRVERSARFHAEDCVFAGNTGAGVVALESAHVEIRVSAFERNGVGLELEECAVATLKGCTLIEHRSDAVRVAGRARLTAEGNRCEDNRGVGIACLGRAEVRLYRNSCMGSRRDGIIARDQVSGVVQDNSCLHNGGSGVVLLSSGRFEVSSNTLSYNRRHGLRLGDEVKARVRLNACRRNHRTGILSASACAPELLENVCEDNQNHGIVLRGGATGQVRANTCMSNARAGLCLMHRASALVTYNSCAHNRAGILVKGSSSGQIELNTCYGNREHSIKIDAEATPQVRSNTFQGLVEGHVRLEEPTQLPTEVEKWRRVPVRSPRRLDMPLSWGVFSPRLRVAVLATGSLAGVMVVVALLFATPVVSLIALMWLA